jgi:hypothetical protein
MKNGTRRDEFDTQGWMRCSRHTPATVPFPKPRCDTRSRELQSVTPLVMITKPERALAPSSRLSRRET